VQFNTEKNCSDEFQRRVIGHQAQLSSVQEMTISIFSSVEVERMMENFMGKESKFIKFIDFFLLL